jgi:photosystem II stability/assembly factor-like uncharacterized protein
LTERLETSGTVAAIDAVSADGSGTTTWAVGRQWLGRETSPLAFRRAAGVWSRSPLPLGTTEIKAVWARGPSEAWIVGTKGLILHFDGRAWNREASGTDETLVAVHGAGRLVWVVGEQGTFLRRRIAR